MTKRSDDDDKKTRRERPRARLARRRDKAWRGDPFDGSGSAAGWRPSEPEAVGPGRNQRLEDVIKARFESAGCTVAFRDDEIWIDDALVGSSLRNDLVGYRMKGNLLRDDRAFGEVVHRFFLDVLTRRARKESQGFDQGLYLQHDGREHAALVVMKGQEAVARITATSFTTASGEHAAGNFWAPGEHWEKAFELLLPRGQRARSAQPPLVEQTPAVTALRHLSVPTVQRRVLPPVRHDPPPARELCAKWPADASTKTFEFAVQASERLLTHRGRADECRVELIHGCGTALAFEPIERDRRTGRLDLPFELSTGSGELHGRIHLGSPNTPMAIRVVRHTGTLPLAEGWALALRAAADRFCVVPGSDAAEPRGFTPDAATAELVRHRVSAHMTRLQGGHRAHDDAVKAAEDVGIELPAGYTWTRSHLRGGNGDGEADRVLRYRWSPQDELLADAA